MKTIIIVGLYKIIHYWQIPNRKPKIVQGIKVNRKSCDIERNQKISKIIHCWSDTSTRLGVPKFGKI